MALLSTAFITKESKHNIKGKLKMVKNVSKSALLEVKKRKKIEEDVNAKLKCREVVQN